jgi:hypothetical protein
VDGEQPFQTGVPVGNWRILIIETFASPLRAENSIIFIPRSVGSHKIPENSLHRSVSALPVYFFNMTVHFNRQPVPTFCPAGFNYFSPICGGHTRSKTMDTHPPANLRLISSLRHKTFNIPFGIDFLIYRLPQYWMLADEE